jgi:hypothetical protein
VSNKPQTSELPSAVRAAIETRNAADQLLNFGLAIRSWGVWALVLGMGFACVALGLRFENPGDMQAPEFISCLAFSSIVAVVGAVVYLFEHNTRRTVYDGVLRVQPSDARVITHTHEVPLPNGSPEPAHAALEPSSGKIEADLHKDGRG